MTVSKKELRASPGRGGGRIPRPWGRLGDARPIVRAGDK